MISVGYAAKSSVGLPAALGRDVELTGSKTGHPVRA